MREHSGKRIASAVMLLLAGAAGAPTVTALTPDRSWHAAAVDDFHCGAMSALAERLGDRYHDLDDPIADLPIVGTRPRVARNDDSTGLEGLRHALVERAPRAGAGYRIECHGAGRTSPYPVVWRFDLAQIERVDTLAGESLLTAFEDRFDVVSPIDEHRVGDVLVAEVMTIPDPSQWYVASDGTTLRSGLRARRRGASGAYLVEIDRTLTRFGDGLQLTQTIFTNGHASERAVWRLTP